MLRSVCRPPSPTLLLLLIRQPSLTVAQAASESHQQHQSCRAGRSSSNRRPQQKEEEIQIKPREHLFFAQQQERQNNHLFSNTSKREQQGRTWLHTLHGGNDDGEHPDDRHFQTLCEKGQLVRALDALSRIHTPLSINVYLSLLKACIKKKTLAYAKHVHAHLAGHRINLTGLLGDYLVVTLAKCGAIEDACRISHTLPGLTVHSWTAIISAYADSGSGHEALKMHQSMQQDGVEPSSYTFVSLFKACGNIQDLEQGKKLHADARRKGFTSNVFVINTLLSMYGKCGAVVEAEDVFCALPQRSIASWSAMLSAYVQQGQGEKALQLYRQMQEEGVRPNHHALVSALRACGTLSEKEEATLVEGRPLKVTSLGIGQTLHAHSCMKDFPTDMFLGTALLTMYGKCGAVTEAINVFHALLQRDLVSWTAMLSTLVEQGQGEEALLLYRLMQEEGLSPNQVTFVIVLQACGILAKKENSLVKGKPTKGISLEIGKSLHADAQKKGYASDVLVGTALVSMYSNCGTVAEAEDVFGTLLQYDIVAWNAMLSTYVEQGQGEKALRLYRQMQVEGVSSNQPTFVIALQACGILTGAIESPVEKGTLTKEMSLEIVQALHADARRKGYTSDIIVGNTLLSLYGKCGAIVEAENVFGALSRHDIVSWTAVLLAYVEQGQGEKALWLHRQMLKEGITLDDVTLVCVLQACKDTGSLRLCEQLHFDIVSAGYDQFPSLAVTLIDTYGSCASMVDAEAVFDGLHEPDITSWTACITGHAGEGDSVASLHRFEKLKLAGFKPDEVMFTSVLSACCHTGLVMQGLEYFDSMSRDYDVTLEPYHYGIVMDLLGRAGDFTRVENMLGKMLMQADLTVWLCLLGACRTHGNLELAKQAFNHAVDLQPKVGTAYIFMSNIYADGLQEVESQAASRKTCASLALSR